METNQIGEPDSRHSWVVALVGAVAMIFTFGTPLSYGIFREPFSEAFGVSPLALSGAFSVMLFMFFIGSGLVGVFGVRIPSHAVLLACATATGLLAPSVYLVESIVGLTVLFAVLGLALGTVFVLVASVIPRWFDEYSGAATGLIFVGNGLGLSILPPVWQYALSEFGVRQGFLGIMGITTAAFVLAGVVCRRPAWVEHSSATTGEILAWVSRLGHTRSFQLLFVGMALAFAWYQLLAAYAVDLFIYRGLTETGASAAFGLIGGVSIISRIGGGYLGDLIGAREAFLLSLVFVTAGVALLLAPSVPLLSVAIFLIGLGLGAGATLYIPLLMSIYTPEKDTAIVGVFNVAGGIASLGMPPLGTASVAYTGDFRIAILLTLAAIVIAFGTIAIGTADS